MLQGASADPGRLKQAEMTSTTATLRYFEDVRAGELLPSLEKKVSLVRMMAYGAATWDFVRLHYDATYALRNDLPAPLVDGQMLGAFLAQMVQDWAGPRGFLRKLSFQNRGMVFAGDSVTCHGCVSSTYRQEGHNLVECRLWIENERGETVVRPASATLQLPSRSDAP